MSSAERPVRECLLDAAAALLVERGYRAVRMQDVAAAAGVSRQTLYNEFGSRQALVEAYVAREIENLIAEVTKEVLANADDAHRALRIAFTLFLKLASDEPVVQLITSNADGGELHQLLTGLGRAVASERIAHLIPQVWPQVGADDARLLAESLVRLAISHALLPSQDPAATARDVGRMLGPFVDELLTRPE
jgi:AcrR family transcriptional regulator